MKNHAQDASLKAKISLLRLRHTFLAILMERKQKSEVHTIKPSVIDHIFNLKIGSERRSMKVRRMVKHKIEPNSRLTSMG